MNSISIEDFEGYLDERFLLMLKMPLAFGKLNALESECFLMLEMSEHFCRPNNNASDLQKTYDEFRSIKFPKCPIPLMLSDYLSNHTELEEKDAAHQLVKFFSELLLVLRERG